MMASDYVGRKERNVLFNESLNTFYLGLYGIGHKVKRQKNQRRPVPVPVIGVSYKACSECVG